MATYNPVTQRRYYLKHRERILEHGREWTKRNFEQVKIAKMRLHRKVKYGLTEEQFQAILLIQNGRCAICREVMTVPHVDHNHETKEVRGLLCLLCNAGIGKLKDDPNLLRLAVKYLEGDRPWQL